MIIWYVIQVMEHLPLQHLQKDMDDYKLFEVAWANSNKLFFNLTLHFFYGEYFCRHVAECQLAQQIYEFIFLLEEFFKLPI